MHNCRSNSSSWSWYPTVSNDASEGDDGRSSSSGSRLYAAVFTAPVGSGSSNSGSRSSNNASASSDERGELRGDAGGVDNC